MVNLMGGEGKALTVVGSFRYGFMGCAARGLFFFCRERLWRIYTALFYSVVFGGGGGGVKRGGRGVRHDECVG